MIINIAIKKKWFKIYLALLSSEGISLVGEILGQDENK